MGKNPIRILVAAEPVLTRAGIIALLADIPSLQVVAEARQGTEVIARCEQGQVDLVLLDLAIEKENCVITTARLHKRFPGVRVLVMANSEEYQRIQQAIEAGSAGILWKNAEGPEMAEAIQQAASSQPDQDRRPDAAIQSLHLRLHPGQLGGDLTGREAQVLEYIAQGLTNAQIGKEMRTSQATIKTQVSSILSKLGVSSRTQAAAVATRLQLLNQRMASPQPAIQDPHEAKTVSYQAGLDVIGQDFSTGAQAALLLVELVGRAVVTVQNHLFVFANPVYRQFSPFPEIDPVGQRYEWVWTAEEGPTSWNAVQQVIQSGSPIQFHQAQPPWTNGSPHDFYFQMVPMEWQGQAALGLLIWDAAAYAPVPSTHPTAAPPAWIAAETAIPGQKSAKG